MEEYGNGLGIDFLHINSAVWSCDDVDDDEDLSAECTSCTYYVVVGGSGRRRRRPGRTQMIIEIHETTVP